MVILITRSSEITPRVRYLYNTLDYQGYELHPHMCNGAYLMVSTIAHVWVSLEIQGYLSSIYPSQYSNLYINNTFLFILSTQHI